MLRKILKTVASELLFNQLRYRPPVTRENTLYLTFDDGPTPRTTLEILNILDSFQVKASFFLSGSNVSKHPELVYRQLKDGHIIGNHGFLHRTPREIGANDYLNGIDKTQTLIDQVAGKRLYRMFRPPYGTLSLSTFPTIIRQGYQIVMWNFDSQDSFITDHIELINVATKFNDLGSTIMLLHDDGQITVDVLPELITHAFNSGYLIKPLPLAS